MPQLLILVACHKFICSDQSVNESGRCPCFSYGARLMNKTFMPNNPIVVLVYLSTQTGKDFQIWYMQIFSGAMTGVRNPKAHDNIVTDRKSAIHCLFLASLLMAKIDENK